MDCNNCEGIGWEDCWLCRGSGEGMSDGTACKRCRGTGRTQCDCILGQDAGLQEEF